MRSQRSLGWLLAAPAGASMALLFFLPAGFLLVYSFWTSTGFRIVPDFSLSNYVKSLTSALFIDVTFNAVAIGLVTAAASVALSIPVAYYLTYVTRSKTVYYAVLITWFSSYLVRIYAWRTMLGTNGLLNTLLIQIGAIDAPIEALLFSRFAVALALVHIYLPFCVLLVVSSFSEIKKELLEAARDLGTGPFGAFWKVVAPNAANGLIGAFTLTFLLAAGDYVTPQMLGGTTGQTTGLLIADYFRRSGNWPLGAAQAFIMFAISVAVYGTLILIGRVTGLVPNTKRARSLKEE